MRKFAGDEDGTALVEMTLAAPLLIALAIGAMAFGQIMLDYATANKSMRNAARYLSRLPASLVCNTGLTAAKNMALYGQETSGTALMAIWTDPATITMTSPACSSGTPTDPFNVRLTAAIPYSNTTLAAIGLSSSMTLSVSHEEPHVGN